MLSLRAPSYTNKLNPQFSKYKVTKDSAGYYARTFRMLEPNIMETMPSIIQLQTFLVPYSVHQSRDIYVHIRVLNLYDSIKKTFTGKVIENYPPHDNQIDT